MSSIEIISSPVLLLDKIKSSNQIKPYDFIYVSYGSKVNEHHFQIESSKIPTNSHLQIVPHFLQVRNESTKILCISILPNMKLL
jgi:hypothetical protein